MAFVYYGNAGGGLSLRPRQLRSDGSVQIAPLGLSNSPTAFQLRLNGRMPLGREDVKLQWQIAPLGRPQRMRDEGRRMKNAVLAASAVRAIE